MPPKRRHLPPHVERQSYARAEPPDAAQGGVGLGDRFLIVCEGEVTELMYLESLRRVLKRPPIEVRTVHPPYTDAWNLVKFAIIERQLQATRARDNHDEIRFDHVWVVFDTDNAKAHGHLGPAIELARTNKVNLAPSTPCFEFWLLLHFAKTTKDFLNCNDVENALADHLKHSYSKSRDSFPKLWKSLHPRILNALANASYVRQHHKDAGTQCPANPSTDFDHLVNSLNQTVRPELRLRHPAPGRG